MAFVCYLSGETSEIMSVSMAKDKDCSYNADSSFDLMGSLIPAGQGNMNRQTSREDTRTPDIFTPSSKASSTCTLFKVYKLYV